MLIILCGLCLLAAGIYMIINDRKKAMRCTAWTNATVVDFSESVDSENHVLYSPIVEYEVEGKMYRRKRDLASNRRSNQIGDTITLYYDPSDPDVFLFGAHKDQGSRMMSFICLGAGVVTLIVGAYSLIAG